MTRTNGEGNTLAVEENGAKALWAVTLEYFLAAPILGAPCYLTVPIWAGGRGSIPVAGIIFVGVFHIALAVYQLKRTQAAETSGRTNLYALVGGVFFILSLISVAFLLQYVTPIPSDYAVQGTASTTNTNSIVMIFASFAFGYFLGLAVLYLAYAGIQYSKRTPSE